MYTCATRSQRPRNRSKIAKALSTETPMKSHPTCYKRVRCCWRTHRILLFSMGIIALMGLQAITIKKHRRKYRVEAAFLANQIIGQMWADNPANLAGYAHHPTAAAGACNFSGAASANANVTAWLGDTATQGTVAGNLPGATSARQQIAIGAGNLVTVTICWQGPQEAAPHSFVTAAQISG